MQIDEHVHSPQIWAVMANHRKSFEDFKLERRFTARAFAPVPTNKKTLMDSKSDIKLQNS
jgi:hypothetical protein